MLVRSKLKLNNKSKTRKVLPLLSKENIDTIMEQIPEVELNKNVFDMTIGEFISIMNNELSYIEDILIHEKYLFTALGKLKMYKRQMNELGNFFKMYEMKQSKEEKQAAVGVVFPDFDDKMLLSVTKFFNLHSFEEAKKVKLGDYLVIFQDESANALYQRNYNNIINQQMKQKPKK